MFHALHFQKDFEDQNYYTNIIGLELPRKHVRSIVAMATRTQTWVNSYTRSLILTFEQKKLFQFQLCPSWHFSQANKAASWRKSSV